MSWSNFTCTGRVVEIRFETVKIGLDVLAWCFRMVVARVVVDSRVGVWDVSRNMRATLGGNISGNVLIETPMYRLFLGDVDLQLLLLELKFIDSLVVVATLLMELGNGGLQLDDCGILLIDRYVLLVDDGGLLEQLAF